MQSKTSYHYIITTCGITAIKENLFTSQARSQEGVRGRGQHTSFIEIQLEILLRSAHINTLRNNN